MPRLARASSGRSDPHFALRAPPTVIRGTAVCRGARGKWHDTESSEGRLRTGWARSSAFRVSGTSEVEEDDAASYAGGGALSSVASS
jgi:hypothetical protein